MNKFSRIERAYRQAPVIPLERNGNYVFFSDCHRGTGSWNDNFANNQSLCFTALNYYYERNFYYVEIGDGDELWENRSQNRIIETHSHVFWLMRKFYEKNRMFMIWGNHDADKRKRNFVRRNYMTYWNECSKKKEALFPELQINEGVRFQSANGEEIFAVHGHQGDIMNDYLQPLSKFLVRFVWKPLEKLGLRDPTVPARNYRTCECQEKRFCEFAETHPLIVIAGHTHRPVFPEPGAGRYFNDGSMVHPRCITAIEVVRGSISLVKWSVSSRRDGSLFVNREVLEGPTELRRYFESQG